MNLLLFFALPLLHIAPILSGADLLPDQTGPIDRLSWLSGCWSNERDGRRYDEQWMKPSGGTMMGMSRTVANGKTIEYEFLQIRQDTSGTIFYVAFPSGQKETWFRLTSSSNGEFVFENPGHDFPQRITYRNVRTDSLVATAEGIIRGEKRAIDFPMKRTACP